MINQIKNQLDFYFSNANIRTDKFLQSELQKNDNKIKASVILTFNKMKALKATIETLKEAVMQSELVEYKEMVAEEVGIADEATGEAKSAPGEAKSAAGEAKSEAASEAKSAAGEAKSAAGKDLVNDFYIQKIVNSEYNEYFNDKEIDNRVLLIKGFDSNLQLHEIEGYLKDYFEFASIRMRRDFSKNFKGSVFVELKKNEDVEKILKMKIPVKIEKEENVKRRKIDSDEKENDKNDKDENACVVDNFLLVKRKNKYFKDKKEEKQKKKEEKAKNEILQKFKGKYFKYETEIKEIKIIKEIIKEAAFVDLKNEVLRFKKEVDFEEKEYEKNELKIKVKKLNEEEEKKYSENINFKSVGKKKINKKA